MPATAGAVAREATKHPALLPESVGVAPSGGLVRA